MKGEAPISGIYRCGQKPQADGPAEFARILRLRRRLWREASVIAVMPDELPEPLRSDMRRWAEVNYGRG